MSGFVATLGGSGLFVVSFLDSSILSFPFVPDAMVIDLSVQKPTHMIYYAMMATVGSLAGCVWLYFLAKKGGEAYFHKHAGAHAERTKRWVQGNGFGAMFISSILPPPLPLFKVVVLAEGVFQVPFSTFCLSLLTGRGVRFVVEGILAVHYGPSALVFLVAHKVAFAVWGFVTLVALWAAGKFFLRHPPHVPQKI
jgi:membrane protein YqaA with SNARE-associated domain